MKKYGKKLLQITVATGIAFSCCSTLLANGMELTMPKGVQEIQESCSDITEEAGMLYKIKNDNVCSRVYTKDYRVEFLRDPMFNYVFFSVPCGGNGQNTDKFREVYQEYKEKLDFDYAKEVEIKTMGQGVTDIQFSMGDYLNADGDVSMAPEDFTEKLTVVQEMVATMLDADVQLEDGWYYSFHSSIESGGYEGAITFTSGATEEQLAVVSERVAVYDDTFEVENLWDEYYQLTGIEDFAVARTVCKELQDEFAWEVYPSVAYMALYQSVDVGFVDLLKTPLLGDVNMDGKIELTDTILVKKYDAGAVTLAEEQKANADLDGNGTVDSNDAVQLLRFLLRLEESIG